MARNFCTLTTASEVALVAATAKTVLQWLAPTGIIIAIQGIDVSFDGTSSSAEPVIIQVFRQTTAGTMTTRNPLKTKDRSTTLQSTGQVNATAEPTNTDLLRTWHVHPQMGVIYPLPLPDGEIELASATRLGLVITAPANVNCLATISAEE